MIQPALVFDPFYVYHKNARPYGNVMVRQTYIPNNVASPDSLPSIIATFSPEEYYWWLHHNHDPRSIIIDPVRGIVSVQDVEPSNYLCDARISSGAMATRVFEVCIEFYPFRPKYAPRSVRRIDQQPRKYAPVIEMLAHESRDYEFRNMNAVQREERMKKYEQREREYEESTVHRRGFCDYLEYHHKVLQDDPERLTTDFIKKIIHPEKDPCPEMKD
jgi:hypothetical protein